MEYLDGHTLKHVIEAQPLGSDRLLQIAVQMVEALEAAHTQGIIHRDVKPANIFVTRQNQVKVLDFGLAKLARKSPTPATGAADTGSLDQKSREQLTNPGRIIGTVSYMSPEQARGEELDIRTDLFSLGAVLYEMATGKVAFDGTTVALVFDAILHRDPLSAKCLDPRVPRGLTHIIEKALQKDREERYKAASEILKDLKAIAAGRDALIAGRAAFRRKLWVTAVIMLAIAGAICASFIFRHWRSHQISANALAVRLTSRARLPASGAST